MSEPHSPVQQGVHSRGATPVDNLPYGASCWAPPQDEEIDLRELLSRLWAGKWLILAVAGLFGLIAVAVTLQMPNIYKSEVLLAPAAQEDKGALAGLAGQFGGLASLAGISMGGSGLDQTTLALEVLKSRAFLAEFVRKHQLEVPLMAAKRWDAIAGQWEINEEAYDTKNSKWVRTVSPPLKSEPSDLELHEKFVNEVMSVNQDKKSGLVSLSVSLMSPAEAARWASLLIKDLNEYMRARDVSEAEKSIAYLNAQLSKTSLADMQQIFYQLIEQQTRTVMLANVRGEYVLKTVDPAMTPERKDKPRRAFICLISGLFGIFLAVIFVLLSSVAVSKK